MSKYEGCLGNGRHINRQRIIFYLSSASSEKNTIFYAKKQISDSSDREWICSDHTLYIYESWEINQYSIIDDLYLNIA